MSAGNFITASYVHADSVRISKIRIQPETLLLSINGTANTAPSGPVNNNSLFVKVSKGKKEVGWSPMKVRLKINGTPPTGYSQKSIITLPLLNAAIQREARNATSSTTVAYLDAGWTVIGIQKERVK